jgi:hypothetical protein
MIFRLIICRAVDRLVDPSGLIPHPFGAVVGRPPPAFSER